MMFLRILTFQIKSLNNRPISLTSFLITICKAYIDESLLLRSKINFVFLTFLSILQSDQLKSPQLINAFYSQCKIPQIHLKQIMSVLSQKLQQASKLFQSHNFKKSLEAYQDCINFCHKTHQDQSILLNIMSTKATLQYILGEYDQALTILNSILSKDCCHFLSLMRRSQVYKKKNKLKKALKDLEQIFVFCPDNLQISALKVEIQHLLIKQGKVNELSSQSESENEQEQEQSIKFMNLKNIDRKSSIQSSRSGRKSRVTILGDQTFEYKCQQTIQTKQSPEEQESLNDKAVRTYKEIQSDNTIEDEIPAINLVVPKKAKKSILKNKGVSIFIQFQDNQQKQSKYLGRESKLTNLIKNIDGRVIASAQHEHQLQSAHKQVQFRKSVSQFPLQFRLAHIEEQELQVSNSKISNNSCLSSSSKRKSCLKRPSFQVKEPARRISKFDNIDKKLIDGKILVNPQRKSLQLGEVILDKGEESHSDNEGSQHNIFGSKGGFMSQDLKQKLGLLQPESNTKQNQSQFKMKPKQSILKKKASALFQKRVSTKQSHQLSSEVKTWKSKKSVMFNCTL